MWPHAEAPQREPGETGAVGQDHVEVLDRDRFGLGRSVDVHELRQDELDAVVLEKLLGLLRRHGLPFRFLRSNASEVATFNS
jgi:hypothetical protein